MNWSDYHAALFDLDGVLTPTAEVHMRAWQRMFSDYLDGRGVAEQYTSDDYFAHVDGKPRFDGVRDFLASRGISLPEGTADDLPVLETVCGLGNRKNAVFSAILDDEGVAPYAASVSLLDHLGQEGTAADLLGVTAARSVVFEDALSGVASGRAGKFGLVVGVDRGVGAQPLLDGGADLVVAELDELVPGTVHRRVPVTG